MSRRSSAGSSPGVRLIHSMAATANTAAAHPSATSMTMNITL
ncbi:MAG TPA: hypothetical protein VIE40_08615 [Dehalococcoidia bacterium]|jgi:hypothetical protein